MAGLTGAAWQLTGLPTYRGAKTSLEYWVLVNSRFHTPKNLENYPKFGQACGLLMTSQKTWIFSKKKRTSNHAALRRGQYIISCVWFVYLWCGLKEVRLWICTF